MKNYRLKNATITERVYVDPINQQDSVVIKSNSAPKKAGSRVVMNASSSVRQQKFVALPEVAGCNDPCRTRDSERLTCTISFSGSTVSVAAMKELLTTTFDIAYAQADDLLLGFMSDSQTLAVGILPAEG